MISSPVHIKLKIW